MFNKLVTKMNGAGVDPVALEAELAKVAADRADTLAAIERANGRRHQALMDDETDAEIDKIERQIDRANTRLEKLGLAEAGLREQLAAAKAALHRKAIERCRAQRLALYLKFRPALEAVAALQREIIAQDMAACAEIGEHAARRELPTLVFRALLMPEFVATWIQDMDRAFPARSARAAVAAPAALAPKPTLATTKDENAPTLKRPPARASNMKTPTPTDSQHGIRLDEWQPPAPPRERGSDDTSPLAPGEARVKVLRGGYSPAGDAPQCDRGQLLKLPIAVANRALAVGAVEILEQA
jgi:hypothetical protein